MVDVSVMRASCDTLSSVAAVTVQVSTIAVCPGYAGVTGGTNPVRIDVEL